MRYPLLVSHVYTCSSTSRWLRDLHSRQQIHEMRTKIRRLVLYFIIVLVGDIIQFVQDISVNFNLMLCYSYCSPTLTVINSHECEHKQSSSDAELSLAKLLLSEFPPTPVLCSITTDLTAEKAFIDMMLLPCVIDAEARSTNKRVRDCEVYSAADSYTKSSGSVWRMSVQSSNANLRRMTFVMHGHLRAKGRKSDDFWLHVTSLNSGVQRLVWTWGSLQTYRRLLARRRVNVTSTAMHHHRHHLFAHNKTISKTVH